MVALLAISHQTLRTKQQHMHTGLPTRLLSDLTLTACSLFTILLEPKEDVCLSCCRFPSVPPFFFFPFYIASLCPPPPPFTLDFFD